MRIRKEIDLKGVWLHGDKYLDWIMEPTVEKLKKVQKNLLSNETEKVSEQDRRIKENGTSGNCDKIDLMEWLYISGNNNTDDHAVRILHEMKQQTNSSSMVYATRRIQVYLVTY